MANRQRGASLVVYYFNNKDLKQDDDDGYEKAKKQ